MMNIVKDNRRDSLLTDFGKATLSDRYLFDGEAYQDRFASVAWKYRNDDAHGQRIYDYLSRHWFMCATPILSGRELPISCFLNEPQDTMNSIADTWHENVHLAKSGGGIGTYWGNIRSLGEPIENKGKTSGVIPFIKVSDSATIAVSQGSLRRGSAAAYMPINHPEIEEFVDIRRPTGGDPNRRSLNIHHGVMINDAFMSAVETGADYALVSPVDGRVVKTIKARDLWIRILTARLEMGEPYIIFSDTVRRARPDVYKRLGLGVKTSNLCVAGDTRILTRDGYKKISDIAGTNAVLWNGKEWSESRVEKTSDNSRLRKIVFSNGAEIWATDEHKFYVKNSYHQPEKEIRAIDLKSGDKIVKCDFPTLERGENLDFAYVNGFHSADGTYSKRGKPIIWLYGAKKELLPEFTESCASVSMGGTDGRIAVYYEEGVLKEKFFVPHSCDRYSKLQWLAGFLDGDGCSTDNNGCQTIQFTSCELDFLNEIRLLLNTLGADCTISLMRGERETLLPDGKGGKKYFECRPCYRGVISSKYVQHLLDIGLNLRRLSLKVYNPQRCAKRHVTVVSNGTEFKTEPTYCANEPKRHRIMLEGILTGNCAEITLSTGIDHLGEERTAVCCLSSLNLEYYNEWKDDPQFFYDVMSFLDNVLQDFIDRAPDDMSKARYSAMRERSVGLGVMGFHSFLQSIGVPFEGVMAKVWNGKIFKNIYDHVSVVNGQLGRERGSAPDIIESGQDTPQRFSHATAIAPTASISVIAGGASPGIDPVTANVFLQKTLSGSFTVKNRHLRKVLASYGKDTDEVWSSITVNQGSVQHLVFLSQDEKDTYKTALEIDQRWVISHAADRQPFVDQSQSLNVWLPGDIHKRDLHEIHFSAWKKGVKSLYYCRSASKRRSESVSGGVEKDNVKPRTEPDECMVCQ